MNEIEITGLQFSYPLSDFRLEIPDMLINGGDRVAFVGPSGFGKTTLLNLISGIFSPAYGTIRIGTQEMNRLSESEKRSYRISQIGFIFQDFKLLEYLSALENILLPFRINRTLKKTSGLRDKAIELGNSLGIGDKLSKYPSKLSQGERQRVAIARALINDPKLILADEPTGNLDPENKHKIKELLFDLTRQLEATLITVTHDHELLEGFDTVYDFNVFHQKQA